MRKSEIIALSFVSAVSAVILLLGIVFAYQTLSQDNTTDIAKAESTVDMAYFQQAIPSTSITSITAIADTNLSLNHLYRLTTANDQHLLITQDKRYLVIGAVMDLQTGELIGNDNQSAHAVQR
jgi:hypothetical protein